MKISILIPTRKRPDNIKRLLNQLEPILNNIEIVLGIDIDDDSYDIDYLKSFNNVIIVRTPKTIYLSNLYNILFEYSKNEIIGYLADDLIFLNINKFKEISEYYTLNKNNFLYYFSPCDQPFPHCVPDHAFVTRESIRSLGFIFPQNLEHGYLDHYLGRLYKEIGYYKLDTGSFIHHERDGKDQTYFVKSFQKDENGLTCDDRDLITFNKICERYLDTHKKIIQELNA